MPPKLHFYAGKGGVGKTTCAAAAALCRAEAGASVLVISSDPAHSLRDAFGARSRRSSDRVLSSGLPFGPWRGSAPKPWRVKTKRGSLFAVELDSDAALSEWLRAKKRVFRMIAERGTYLDREDIDQLMELSLPGVDELVGLIEIDRLSSEGEYEEVYVDTAPTGHTLRLLAMPKMLKTLARVLDDMQAKHRFLSEALGGTYRADMGDRVIEDLEEHAERLEASLRDPMRCDLSWVILPEMLVVEETKDAIGALESMGLNVASIVVNRWADPKDEPCETCTARHRDQARAISALSPVLRGRSIRRIPFAVSEPSGLARLRAIGRALSVALRPRDMQRGLDRAARAGHRTRKALRGSLVRASARGERRKGIGRRSPGWLDAMLSRKQRLYLFGGKGGVGKTTCACAFAIALARRAKTERILLLSVDPAHSLSDALKEPIGDREAVLQGGPANLSVRELDSLRVFEEKKIRHRASVAEWFRKLERGSRFEIAYDKAVLEDLIDLAPPGIDELFGLLHIIDALFPSRAADGYERIVVDTAPTGHALRLLGLPSIAREWVKVILRILLKYREVMGLGEMARDLVELSQRLRAFEALLQDPEETCFVSVTRAASLPMLETERLQRGLLELKVPIGGTIVNAVTSNGCARCRRIRQAELRAVRGRTGKRSMGRIETPLVLPPPRGLPALERWALRWRVA